MSDLGLGRSVFTDYFPGVSFVVSVRCFALIMLVSVLGCLRGSSESNGRVGHEPAPPSVSESLPSSPEEGLSEKEQESQSTSAQGLPNKEQESQTASSTQQSSSSVDRLDEQPLLLLDEETENQKTDSMADNSRCLVCHLNYELEDIAITHAREGYGCAHCHGQSDAHIADESWASGGNGTPPDIMYRPNEVIPACLKCHELSKSDPECHCEFPRLDEKKSCTDCHGNHRLQSRKCRWK